MQSFSDSRFDRLALQFALAGTALLFVPGLPEAFETPKHAWMVGIAIVLLARVAWRTPPLRPAGVVRSVRWDAFTAAWAGVLLSAVLSTGFARSPRTAFFGAPESCAGLPTFAAAATLALVSRRVLRDPRDVRRVLLAAEVAATLAALLALAQLAEFDPLRWTQTSAVAGQIRPFATLGHPIHLGALMVIALPLIGARAIDAGRTGHRRACAAGAVSALVVLAGAISSYSRAAWIVLVLVSSPWLGIALRAAEVRGRARSVVGLAVAAALLLGVAFVVTSYGRGSRIDAVHARLASLVRLQDEPRIEIARAAIAIARAHPITGVGLDGFGLAFGPHRTAAYWTLEPEQTPLRAHQPLLQVAATQGIVGLAGWGALVLVATRAARRALHATRGSVTHGLVIALVASLASFVLVTASGFVVAATGTLAAVVAGALAGLAAAETEGTVRLPSFEARAPSRIVRVAVTVIALAACAVFIALPLASDALAARGDAWLRAGRSVRATQLHVHAAQLTPWRERGFTRLAAVLYTRALAQRDPVRARRRLDEARAVTDAALASEPLAGWAHANRARVLGRIALADRDATTTAESFAEWDRALTLEGAHRAHLEEAIAAARALGDEAHAQRYAALRRAADARTGTRVGEGHP